MVAAPGVERANGLEHGAYALWIFAVPQLLAAMLEAPASIAADGLARNRIIALGMGVLAASLALCALAPSPWLLSLALALAGAASGVACSAAQVALIAEQPGRAASVMARWTACASAGDLLSPLIVAAALALGCDHRAALAGIALLVALHSWLAVPRNDAVAECVTAPTAEDAALVPLRDALRLAARSPRLWLYLAAEASCCLLDEVVVALAALRLHDDLGWSAAASAASATAIAIGSLGGALLVERLLERVAAHAVLLVSALVSLCALGWFVSASSTAGAVAALALLGAAAASHHPLTRAASYELLPGRTGLVNALTQLFVPLDVGLPLAIGVLASFAGLGPALLALSVQPVAMLVVALAMHRAGASSSDDRGSG